MSKALSLSIWGSLLSGLLAAAQPANDNFTNSVQLTGTNLTYSGTLDGATLEQGEPVNGATNTVWMSWTAPADGYAQVQKATSPQFQYYAVYTGTSVTSLQPVTLTPAGGNSIYYFLATQGTVYHFQFSGGANTITFYLQFHEYGPCVNDNFADAQVEKGNSFSDNKTVVGATMEPGEPAHMGGIPEKSIWWKCQAPFWGTFYINPTSSTASNVTLAVYAGSAVDTLVLVAKSDHTSPFGFSSVGGQTYYIAGAVPTNDVGNIGLSCEFLNNDSSTHIIPGNLLQEPSWENTGVLDAQYWKWSGSLSGYVNEYGGADGTTWPVLSTGTEIWQDFPTVPGHSYTVHFAYLIGGSLSGGVGDAQVVVIWDTNQLGVSTIPASESGFWHWDTYTTFASNTTSRITFQNIGRNLEMDAFSVVDESAPPFIVTEPASASSLAGGMAEFDVGVTGTLPLCYQWFFNGSPLAGQTNKMLLLNGLTSAQAGDYQAIITNGFGAVTSVVASLSVDDPVNATILSQPYGDVVPAGGYFNFGVVAAGAPPLAYQWFQNNQSITGATNSNLMLVNVQPTNAGTYMVRVQNPSSTVWSLPATLSVTETNIGGGTIDFQNDPPGLTNQYAPIFDIDGVTPLAGSNYVAQLYAGPSLDTLRPAGQPSPFRTTYGAGYFFPEIITLANVPPGSNAVLQVCVWDARFGSSYEQARAMGGKFGKSNIIDEQAGGGTLAPQPLLGLHSFSLQAGLPFFQVGTISLVQREPPNTIVWALHGQAGSIYLIEKRQQSGGTTWQPFQVVTNVTGTVEFTDTAASGQAATFYRARILD